MESTPLQIEEAAWRLGIRHTGPEPGPSGVGFSEQFLVEVELESLADTGLFIGFKQFAKSELRRDNRSMGSFEPGPFLRRNVLGDACSRREHPGVKIELRLPANPT